MVSTKRHVLMAIAPLFLVLFIDGMGLSLLFPVLNSMIIDPHSQFLATQTTTAERDFLYGLTVGIFMICWFFGAAILGDLSDSVGRKKALLICLIGAFLGYVLSAVAVTMHSLLFLIVGRVIAGFTAGSQPIAQAAIVDISEPRHKARNIGLILLAVSLGFVVGPIIGGLLSDQRIVNWFSFSTPLYFAAFISLVNALLLWYLFAETFTIQGRVNIKLQQAVSIFVSAFQHRKVRVLSLVFLIMIFGWSNFFTFVPMFALQRYHVMPLQVSLLMADLGVGFSIGSGYLVGVVTRYFPMKAVITVSLLLTACFISIILFYHHLSVMWWLLAPAGITISIGYSTLITVFSNQVGAEEQGWVMGVTGAIMALCFGLTSFLTGYLANLSISLPMDMAAWGLVISALLTLVVKNTENIVQSSQTPPIENQPTGSL